MLITSSVMFLNRRTVMVRVSQTLCAEYLGVKTCNTPAVIAVVGPLSTVDVLIFLGFGYTVYPGSFGGGSFLMSVSWSITIYGWLSWMTVNRRFLFDWKLLMFQEMTVMFPGWWLVSGFQQYCVEFSVLVYLCCWRGHSFVFMFCSFGWLWGFLTEVMSLSKVFGLEGLIFWRL